MTYKNVEKRKKMPTFIFRATLIAIIGLYACGSNTADEELIAEMDTLQTETIPEQVTLSGKVLKNQIADKLQKGTNQADETNTTFLQNSSLVGDADVQVVGPDGEVEGSGVTVENGDFEVKVNPGSNYVVRVEKEDLVLKAFIDNATYGREVFLDAKSTAIVEALNELLGDVGLGDEGKTYSFDLSEKGFESLSEALELLDTSIIVEELAEEIKSTILNDGTAEINKDLVITAVSRITQNTEEPLTVTDLIVTPGDGENTLTWKQSTKADSYNIYWDLTPEISLVDSNEVSGITDTFYLHPDLENGTAYYYLITAQNMRGESDTSDVATATPSPLLPDAPKAPTGINVSVENRSVSISWDNDDSADIYNLYVATVTGDEGDKKENAVSPYTIELDEDGVSHYFTVTAVNAGGESGKSQEVGAMIEPVIEQANEQDEEQDKEPTVEAVVEPITETETVQPTETLDPVEVLPVYKTPGEVNTVSVTPGDSEITIRWEPVTDATRYTLYWANRSGVSSADNVITDITTPYVHSGLINGDGYYYIIVADNNGVAGRSSIEVSGSPQVPSPSVPQNVSASAGDANITIVWNPVSGATGYNLYFSTTPEVTIDGTTKVDGVTSNSATETGLTNGTSYFFAISAFNAGGESPLSTEVNATPQVPAPSSAPQALLATAGDGTVTLTWQGISDADSYNVYYDLSKDLSQSTGTLVATVTGTTYTVTGLTNGIGYYYVVSGINAGGESAISNESSATPAAPVPSAPYGLVAIGAELSAEIRFTEPAEATSFNAYHSSTPSVTKENERLADVSNPFVQTGLTANEKHYWKISAKNDSGESVLSGEASARVCDKTGTLNILRDRCESERALLSPSFTFKGDASEENHIFNGRIFHSVGEIGFEFVEDTNSDDEKSKHDKKDKKSRKKNKKDRKEEEKISEKSTVIKFISLSGLDFILTQNSDEATDDASISVTAENEIITMNDDEVISTIKILNGTVSGEGEGEKVDRISGIDNRLEFYSAEEDEELLFTIEFTPNEVYGCEKGWIYDDLNSICYQEPLN